MTRRGDRKKRPSKTRPLTASNGDRPPPGSFIESIVRMIYMGVRVIDVMSSWDWPPFS